MEIELAAEMGLCFGVRRAIELAERAMQEQDEVASLGAIVHNRQVVERLVTQGMRIIDSLDAIRSGSLIIPSHGIGPQIIDQVKACNVNVIDATCPIVRKAQTAARRLHQEGFKVVVFGDASHPEIEGVLSWAGEDAIATLEVPEFGIPPRRLGILSQTTQSEARFASFLSQLITVDVASLSEVYICNTICDATSKRQAAAMELAKKADLILVVGGHDSANTRHLAEICSSAGVTTFHIETAGEIDPSWHRERHRVGVTAGASTPDWVITEVIQELESRSSRREGE